MSQPAKFQCVVETSVKTLGSPTLLIANPADSGVTLAVTQCCVDAGSNNWGTRAPYSCVVRLKGIPTTTPIDAAPTVDIYQLDGLAINQSKAQVFTHATHTLGALPAETYACPLSMFDALILDGSLTVAPGESVAIKSCIDGGSDGVAWIGIGWNETAIP